MEKIVLTVPPISTNKLYRGVKKLTFAAIKNKQAMAYEASQQFHRKLFDKPVGVRVDFYWPNRKCNDIDNKKALYDALTNVVWVDDNLIDIEHVERHYGVASARVEIQIYELP